MGKKKAKYTVESDFDDLHGNPDDMPDLELDLSDNENPIIAAANVDDNWTPPESDEDDDDGKEEDDGDEFEDDDEEDDSELEELDDEDDEDEDLDEEEDEDDEEDDDEDDDKSYSKKVQRRIDRERNLRLQQKQESDQRLAKLERRIELRDAQDTFNDAKREGESKLKSLKRKKITALDEGTTAEVVDIDDEILDIKADLKAKELQLKADKDSIDDDTDDTTGTPPVGRKFLEKYPEFHTNPQFRNVLLLTDKSVAARGFDKNTEEYYAEIERVMKPQFPKIIRGAKITKKRKKKVVRKRGAVGGVQKAGTRNSSKRRMRKGRIRLTKADQQQMEIFGMDPTNAADAKAWAQGKGN